MSPSIDLFASRVETSEGSDDRPYVGKSAAVSSMLGRARSASACLADEVARCVEESEVADEWTYFHLGHPLLAAAASSASPGREVAEEQCSPSSPSAPLQTGLRRNSSLCVEDEFTADDSQGRSFSRQQVRCLTVAALFGRSTLSDEGWQMCDVLNDDSAVAVDAPRYFTVCFADSIPMETGAAKVNLSRLEVGRQWRYFLRFCTEPELSGDLALDDRLECPCCLGILRRPVALPCGHSLCRGCLTRLRFTSAGIRYCPMCRSIIPHMDLHVNESLDAVVEALHAMQNVVSKAHHPAFGPRALGVR